MATLKAQQKKDLIGLITDSVKTKLLTVFHRFPKLQAAASFFAVQQYADVAISWVVGYYFENDFYTT